MLSNETKLDRINTRLSTIGIMLQFDCYDLKTLTPTYSNVKDSRFNGKDNPYVHIGVDSVNTNGKNIVFFYVDNIKSMPLYKTIDFEAYTLIIRDIYDILKYCNKLELEVPEYKS